MGIDQRSGTIDVNALPREGQTIQFQLRDPEAADDDLKQLLSQAKAEMGEKQPVGVLLCCCNGRGVSLFGESGHDVKTVTELLGPLPIAGFFCNGELGPVGGKNFLHGFTASMAIITPRQPRSEID
jgi:small ligand-binding sensory domain FIST